MASDPTAGGAPAEMPVETSDPNLDIPPKPEGAAGEVQQLQAEKADLQDKLLRALAEAQNVRRRAQQDVERERKFGIERFARDILSVADNLGRALSVLPDDADAIDPALRNVIVGVQATERELQSVLERHGITRIESLGRPFNAEFHQAMMEVADPTVAAGTVVQELAPGYMIAGRLLRAAMVAVSKGGPTVRPPSNEN
jgi:molecular chaperone GrpE